MRLSYLRVPTALVFAASIAGTVTAPVFASERVVGITDNYTHTVVNQQSGGKVAKSFHVPAFVVASIPKPVQRSADDNGVSFPTKSGYLKGYPALSVGGYSSVTVDNSQHNSDVFVKLFWLDTTPPKAARVFFIRAHDTFTVEDIKPGNYDVRYRDLTSGVLLRTEQFNLKEVRTARGVQFSKLRLTLYKVPGGKMGTQPLPEGEF